MAAAGGAGGGVPAVPLAGPDAHPELAEALFRLMAEWVKELPVPSLRCVCVCVRVLRVLCVSCMYDAFVVRVFILFDGALNCRPL